MHTTFVPCRPLGAPADGAIRTSASAPQTTTPIRLIPLTSSSPALRSELLLADVRGVAPPSLVIVASHEPDPAMDRTLDRIRTDLASDEALPFGLEELVLARVDDD